MAKRQWGLIGNWAGGKYFADAISKPKSHWYTISKQTRVVVELCQSEDVGEYNFYVGVAARNIDP